MDAQLPPSLADWLRSKDHEAVAVRDIGLKEADDRTIWSIAVEKQAIIVTKDEDFARLAARDPAGARVLWVRTGNAVNRILIASFESAWPELRKHLLSSARVIELR